MIKRICSVWLVGAIIVSAGTALASHTSLVEAPVVALAAAFAPQPLLAQDPECDACVWEQDPQGEWFPQCCVGCGDLYPENDTGTGCTTPTREDCEFDDPCEPTLAFNLLRGDGTVTVGSAEADHPVPPSWSPPTVVQLADFIPGPATPQLVVACDGSVLARTYDEARIVALRAASNRMVL